MLDSKIFEVFCAGFNARVALLPEVFPVKYPGIVFEPPQNHKFWEVIFINNDPEDMYWDKSKVSQGIFRVILHWPIDSEGILKPLSLRDNLAALIPKGTEFFDGADKMVIYENPKPLTVVEEAPQQLFPVSFWYRSFKP